MSIAPTLNFKNFNEVPQPRETIHAQDLFGMISIANGFGVLSGCDITRSTNTITIASGSVLINGVVVIFTEDSVTIDDAGISSGEYKWTSVHITPAGAIGKADSDPGVLTFYTSKVTDTTNIVICNVYKEFAVTVADNNIVPASLDTSNAMVGHLTVINDIDMNNSGIENIKLINFITDPLFDPDTAVEGDLWWNAVEKTLNIKTDTGAILQIGQEIHLRAKNTTASPILNGEVVFINGADGINPTIDMAKADVPTTSENTIGVATVDIAIGEVGQITTFGLVRDLDTSSFSAGDTIYLSATIAGGVTDTQPEIPNYTFKIGTVVVSHADDGVILVNVVGQIEDILQNALNGGFIETINFTVVGDGGADTIIGTLNPSTGSKLTMIFSDRFTDFPIGSTIALTQGTATNPQTNLIFIPKSTKLLTADSVWPAEQHIKVASVEVLTSTITETDGALKVRNWNDHIAGTNGIGHIRHLDERMRQEPANHENGTEATLTITGTPSEVYVAVTSGKVYQLHLQDFPAIDMQAGGDMHIVNDSVTPYKTVTDLAGEQLDAEGNSLNLKSFSFVVWGQQNKTGQMSHLMLNKPINSYSFAKPEDAISDPLGYSVYDIPKKFKGTGFLIARFTFKLQNNTWTLEGYQDLRGKLPNTTAGSGAGGSGISTFLGLTDTPSAYTGLAGQFTRINVGETALEFIDHDLVTAHSDVSDAGSGAIITGVERSALHAQVTTLAHTALSNLNDGVEFQHMSSAQISALHAIYEHPVSHSDGDVSDSIGAAGLTLAKIQAQLMVGSANAQYITLIAEGDASGNFAQVRAFGGEIKNNSATAMNISYILPIPSQVGALKLTITNWRFILIDADANDYVTQIRVFKANASSLTTIYSDTDNATTIGIYNDGSGVYESLTNFQVEENDRVSIQMLTSNTTQDELEITGVYLKCYYS